MPMPRFPNLVKRRKHSRKQSQEENDDSGPSGVTNLVRMARRRSSSLRNKSRKSDLLNQSQLDEIQKAFSEFDLNHDGSIDEAEIGPLMKSLGKNCTSKELRALLDDYDSNQNGKIEFEEFVQLIMQKFEFTSHAHFFIKGRKKTEVEYTPVCKFRGRTDMWKLLTNQEMNELKNAFREYDKDDSGTISMRELTNLMRSLGQNPTEEEVSDLMNELDEDNSGQLDFPEFVNLMIGKFSFILNPTDELREVFSVFDQDGNGFVDVDEFKSAMRKNHAIDSSEVEEMFRMADVNGDGKLDYSEFSTMISDQILEDMEERLLDEALNSESRVVEVGGHIRKISRRGPKSGVRESVGQWK